MSSQRHRASNRHREEWAHRLRLIKARRRELFGLIRLLWASRRGRLTEMWVGDSHSVTFVSANAPLPGILNAGQGRWIWHLGPRVMYSVARDGFPRWLHRAAQSIARTPTGSDVAWLFSFGEIDIRCHLGPRLTVGADLEFVSSYVAQVRGLVEDAGTSTAAVVVPVPPSEDTLNHVHFPVKGTVEERVTAHRAVRAGLLAATGRDSPGADVRVLDATDVLADPSGLMRPALTDDRCHTNAAGRAAVRRKLDAFLAERRTQC